MAAAGAVQSIHPTIFSFHSSHHPPSIPLPPTHLLLPPSQPTIAVILQDEGSAPQGYNISELLLLARSSLTNHRVAALHMLAAVLAKARPSPLDVGPQVRVVRVGSSVDEP